MHLHNMNMTKFLHITHGAGLQDEQLALTGALATTGTLHMMGDE